MGVFYSVKTGIPVNDCKEVRAIVEKLEELAGCDIEVEYRPAEPEHMLPCYHRSYVYINGGTHCNIGMPCEFETLVKSLSKYMDGLPPAKYISKVDDEKDVFFIGTEQALEQMSESNKAKTKTINIVSINGSSVCVQSWKNNSVGKAMAERAFKKLIEKYIKHSNSPHITLEELHYIYLQDKTIPAKETFGTTYILKTSN